MASRNSTDCLNWTLLYNHFAQTTQKTQPLYCWEGMFGVPLHSNGSYSIVACIFVAAGMCLPSIYLTMDVSDFSIPALVRHVTICFCFTRWRMHAVETSREKEIINKCKFFVSHLLDGCCNTHTSTYLTHTDVVSFFFSCIYVTCCEYLPRYFYVKYIVAKKKEAK
jgi:hypothetical protein